jgi:RimJ/RimL family protein N-acetyltransferase
MKPLDTRRLTIRPLQAGDFQSAHDLLERAGDEIIPPEQTRAWLDWTVLSETQLARLHQPPFGERAVVWTATGELTGLVGYVPLLGPYNQVPGLGSAAPGEPWAPEMGLYWAVDPAWRGRGIASEAALAMLDFAFRELRLGRVLATTTFENLASQAVMRKIGMRVERNPYLEPEWLQVVGFRFANKTPA